MSLILHTTYLPTIGLTYLTYYISYILIIPIIAQATQAIYSRSKQTLLFTSNTPLVALHCHHIFILR